MLEKIQKGTKSLPSHRSLQYESKVDWGLHRADRGGGLSRGPTWTMMPCRQVAQKGWACSYTLLWGVGGLCGRGERGCLLKFTSLVGKALMNTPWYILDSSGHGY